MTKTDYKRSSESYTSNLSICTGLHGYDSYHTRFNVEWNGMEAGELVEKRFGQLGLGLAIVETRLVVLL